MTAKTLFFISLLFLALLPPSLFSQSSRRAKTDTVPERYAKLVTINGSCTILYDSTAISKADAFIIVLFLAREGIWSEQVRGAKAIFSVNPQNGYSVTLFVGDRFITNPAADSVLKSVLGELRWLYPKRQYHFQLEAMDSTFSIQSKTIKLK
jgi:hypothetical protein